MAARFGREGGGGGGWSGRGGGADPTTGGGWAVPPTDYDSDVSTDITYGKGGESVCPPTIREGVICVETQSNQGRTSL